MAPPIKTKDKQDLTYKKIVFFSVIFIVLAGMATSLKQPPLSTNVNKNKVLISAAPQKVKITNVFSQGFTVTWLTAEKTLGTIAYGPDKQVVESQEATESLCFKKKEENPNSEGNFVHSVKIDNLQPEGKYYFKIISGEKNYFESISDSWQEAGVAAEISLPVKTNFSSSYSLSLHNSPGSYSQESKAFTACQTGQNREVSSCFRPNPVYGQVVDHKQNPAGSVLVYLEIPGKSNLLSTLTNPEGQWVFDLANLLKNDLSGPLGYDPITDLIKITVVSGVNQPVSSYFSIPSVIDSFKTINNFIKLKT